MKPKTIQMPLPAESAGRQPVKVTEKSPTFVSNSVSEAFSTFFEETDSVKCIMVKTNDVINLQFIGNGCVANLQMYEVRSENAIEPYVPHRPVRRALKTQKGGTL